MPAYRETCAVGRFAPSITGQAHPGTLLVWLDIRSRRGQACLRLEDFDRQIEAFVEYQNHYRYHESLENLTPAAVYCGRGQAILM